MNINPEIIGFVAGGLSSALFIPQIVKKSAEEISLVTCIIGILSSCLWLWYGIVQDHISMIVTNIIAGLAMLILLLLRLIYNK